MVPAAPSHPHGDSAEETSGSIPSPATSVTQLRGFS